MGMTNSATPAQIDPNDGFRDRLIELEDRTDMALGRMRSLLLLLHQDGAEGRKDFQSNHGDVLNIIYFAAEMALDLKREVSETLQVLRDDIGRVPRAGGQEQADG